MSNVKIVKINNARHAFISSVMQISFPKVFKPVYNELSKKNEFSADFVEINEGDLKAPYKGKKTQTVSVLQALSNARVDQWGPKEKWPKWSFDSIKNGDNVKNKDGEIYAGYEGKKFFSAKCGEEYPPKIVGKDGKPLDEKDLYGGALVRVNAIARPVVYGRVIGVRFLLIGIQKVGDGERFGGGPQTDMFDVTEEDEDFTEDFDGGDDAEDDDF